MLLHSTNANIAYFNNNHLAKKFYRCKLDSNKDKQCINRVIKKNETCHNDVINPIDTIILYFI
jgi:hypothetical protein